MKKMNQGPRLNQSDWSRISNATGKRRQRLRRNAAMAEAMQAIRQVQQHRASLRVLSRDPLTLPVGDRLAMWRAARSWAADHQADLAELKKRQAVRKTLYAAARVGRRLGLGISSSRDSAGRISSYYLSDGKRRLRVSDHLVPLTDEREERWGCSTYPAAELIVTGQRDAAWLEATIRENLHVA